ncbi:MAG: dethiobiotin synthase [Desulfuromonadales bacterium]
MGNSKSMGAETFSGKGIFVTGTDTGVGKTLVAAALARFLTGRGKKVGVMKPVETGVTDPSGPGEDAVLLQWASGTSDNLDLLSPYRLPLPLAPALAAENEGIRIDLAHLAGAVRTLRERHEFLIVEGAGGLMVPLAGGLLMADLVRQLDLPLLVVCRPGLGTINHTLLTLFAARAMEIPLAGFIINNMPPQPGLAEESATHTLASLASADLLGVLNEAQGDDREKVSDLARQISRLPTLPWLLAGLGIQGEI